ncbi:MAG: hypothetical protein A4E66_02528 [Syntrophus sp. PtaB.Bin001]|nr:MAG: hypothetical protein A4E66_02528 [Syntrophus sp. PtaB.Bin001]
MLPAEALQMLKQLCFAVLMKKGFLVGFGKINPCAADFFQTAGQTAMIGMIVSQEDLVYVGKGSADLPQIFFQCGKSFRYIQVRVKQCNLFSPYKCERLNMVQPEGHGKRDPVKSFSNFLDQ